MIKLRAYPVDEKRNSVYGYKTVNKCSWPDNHDFGFDINNPVAWRKFLKTLPLRNKTKDGKPIAYNVYKWGGRGQKGGYTNLFPSTYKIVTDEGEEEYVAFPLALYGRLDKLPPREKTRGMK